MAQPRHILILVVAAAVSAGFSPAALAEGPPSGAPPPVVLLNETVKGHLIKIEGSLYVVKDAKGKEVQLDVGRDTLVDKTVKVGDLVEAEVSPDGHARSIVKARQ